MQTVTTKAITRVAAVATGLAMATSMLSFASMAHAASLTDSQVQSILSLLSSFGASSATIANVQAALNGTPTTTTTTTTSSSCSFTKDLTIGSTGSAVTCLQQALIAAGYSIPAGATGYFGVQTQAAVSAWQKAVGVSPTAGYFGAISRAHWNLGGGSSTTTTTTGGTTGTYTGTGNGLKIMLSATSPNGTVLVQGQGIGDLGDFVFANPTASPINVTTLTFNRTGVSNDSTLNNVYLYNGVNRITDSAGVSSSVFSFTNPAGIFTVPAGQTYTVSVRADILTGTSGQQLGVSLVSVASSGTLDSSVSFPIMSGYQTISAATLATVDFNTTTLPATTTISPQSAYPVWQNTITVSTNPVILKSMKFTNLGSIDSQYVVNLRLFVDGVQVGNTLPTLGSDRTAIFDLSATPKTLSTAGHVVKVLADLTGGSQRTVQFSIQRSSDAFFVDSQLNQPITPTKNGSAFTAVTSSGAITINYVSGTTGVSVTTDPASPSSNVPVAGSSVKLATFDLLASGENVKVSDLYVYAATGTPAASLANGKIFVNGVQVGSTKTLGYSSGTHTDFSLGSSLILPAGTTVTVDVYADMKTSAGVNLASGDTVTVYLDAASSNGQGQSSLNSVDVPHAAVHGNGVQVTSSSLTAGKYSGYGNQTMIAGTNTAKLGSFTLSAGSTEGILVNTIVLDLTANAAATVTNLTLKDNATGSVLGSVITTPSSGSNSYSVSFDLPASQSKTIDVYGNIKSSSEAGPIVIGLDYTTGGTGDVTGTSAAIGTANGVSAVAVTGTPACYVALQSITLSSGVLTAALGTSPDNAIVVAGTSMVKVGSFDFTAQYSPYTIDQIEVTVPSGAATSVASVTLSYPNATGVMTNSSANLLTPSTSQPYATAVFTGLTFFVPQNTTKSLGVYVNLTSIQNDGDSGKAVTVSLVHNAGFRKTDSAGTTNTTLASSDLVSNTTGGKGTIIIRKSIPTLTAVALDTSTLTNGTGKALARVKVSADPAGDISWDKLLFNVNMTSPSNALTIGATTTLKLYNGSNAIAGSFATTTGSQGASATNPWGAGTTGGTIAFLPTSEQTILAGQNATYELRGTVGGVTAAGGYTLDISVPNEVTSASTTGTAAAVGTDAVANDSFTWSDKSSIATVHSTSTSDWTDDYLIKALPLTVGSMSASL